LNNQLIVYTPKRNVKKIVLGILLAIFISFLIFMISAIGSTAVCLRIKWNEPVNNTEVRFTFNFVLYKDVSVLWRTLVLRYE